MKEKTVVVCLRLPRSVYAALGKKGKPATAARAIICRDLGFEIRQDDAGEIAWVKKANG